MQLNKREIFKTYVETDCQGKINLTRWGYNCQGCWGDKGYEIGREPISTQQ